MCKYYLIYSTCHETGCENIVSAVNNGELVIWTCKKAEKRLLGRPRKCNGIILDREQYTRRTSASTHRLCGDHGGETWVKTQSMTPEWSPWEGMEESASMIDPTVARQSEVRKAYGEARDST
jgi:hypothetical protein